MAGCGVRMRNVPEVAEKRTVLSVKSINYACVVKNDTPLICTVGVSGGSGAEGI